MCSTSYGFREVVVDQPFAGKWMEVDMNFGGGHGAFHGDRFADSAGGFSYKRTDSPHSILQNRFIYWRSFNDKLELIESSLDYNLTDNEVRYRFQDSPIVGPVVIEETDSSVVILVTTVSSVNRFIFHHPRVTFSKGLSNKAPSIFAQTKEKPLVKLHSFNLCEQAVNYPVPIAAASHYNIVTGESVFALSYQSGLVTICKISKGEEFSMFKLHQTNILSRMLSGITSSILKTSNNFSPDAVVSMAFFNAKVERKNSVFLTSVSMNGQLRLCMCKDMQNLSDWSVISCGSVDNSLSNENTEASLILRRQQMEGRLPNFIVYLPNQGFKVYKVTKTVQSGTCMFQLEQACIIKLEDPGLLDFTVTDEFIFVLISNPEEETDWDIKFLKLDDSLEDPKTRFELTLLEPTTPVDVAASCPVNTNPKDHFVDLVFNKSSFSSQTICKALGVFPSSVKIELSEYDWERLQLHTMNVIDNEIGLRTANTDVDLSEETFTELNTQLWGMLYESCMEYHIHTLKPLGIFFEPSTRMLCIVKKNRISFLRPMDFLETAYYYPQCLPPPSQDSGNEQKFRMQCIIRLLEAVNLIDSCLSDDNKKFLRRKLLEDPISAHKHFLYVAMYSVNVDLEQKDHMETHNLKLLMENELQGLAQYKGEALSWLTSLLSSWGNSIEESTEDDDMFPDGVSEHFMGSLLGTNLAFRTFKQLVHHRYTIMQNLMVLNLLAFCGEQELIKAESEPQWSEFKEQIDLLLTYNSVSKILEWRTERMTDFLEDKGMKVANILNINTRDHIVYGRLLDRLCPTALVELFSYSKVGGLAIRSLMNSFKKFDILGYAECIGAAIWPHCEGTCIEHPFENFMIATCQYVNLKQYAFHMELYYGNRSPCLQKLYQGLSELCTGNRQKALTYFTAITKELAQKDSHFQSTVLEMSGETDLPSHFQKFYIKAISIFQVYEHLTCILSMTQHGISGAEEDVAFKTKMCTLAFKTALELEDYEAAYKFILEMPSATERSQKFSSLRTFVTKILERGHVNQLMELQFSDKFDSTSSVKEHVEQFLFNHANSSDAMQTKGPYQILYLYHLSKKNYHKAAETMYWRVIRLGEKGSNLTALEEQRKSYLDVLTCLRLVKEQDFRYVVRSLVGKDNTKTVLPEPEIITCFDDTTITSLYTDKYVEVRTYEQLRGELKVITAFIKLAPKIQNAVNPIKVTDFKKKAEEAVNLLTNFHYYDEAIELATTWNISVGNIVKGCSLACLKILSNIAPESGDPNEYIKHNDISGLPISSPKLKDISLSLLQSYLKRLEKPGESDLHQEITLQFLAADIEIPQWIVDSYKKRNVGQLIKCYGRYGEWEKATELSVRVLHALLGKRNSDEFDATIKRITPYEPVEPVIPEAAIVALLSQMEARVTSNPSLEKLISSLKTAISHFVNRVLEAHKERLDMFRSIED